jgi:CBS-domain-containing membrane protein
MIQNCMKRNVAAISTQASLGEAAHLFAERRIGLLPVVNVYGQVVGVLGLQDLLELALPAFVHLLETIDFVQDFGQVEMTSPDPAILAEAVTTRMRPATVVAQDCGLLRAYSLMLEHDLHDLPVVDANGHLVGIASRVDIGVAIIKSWEPPA